MWNRHWIFDIMGSMHLSRSSSSAPDPLSHVLEVLGAQVTRRTRMEMAGNWALGFPEAERLKFVAMVRGSAWMRPAGQAPVRIAAGDVCLIGPVAYVIASDRYRRPIDGLRLYDGPGQDMVRIGGQETIAIGGTVTFAGAGSKFLIDMLPDFLMVPQAAAGSGTIATILQLVSDEIMRYTIGADIVGARLADILLVETFRACIPSADHAGKGWLGALLDDRIGRALRDLHADVAHPWTVAELARVAGMSRSAFADEFARRIGQPPLTYLRNWRLTLARQVLSKGDASVAQVAEAVGYRSQGAFSQAFRRTFRRTPTAGSDDADDEPRQT